MAKKKKQTYAEFMKEYYGVGDDIAPVKRVSGGGSLDGSNKTKATQSEGYFQKGALKDGVSAKNVYKTVAGSATDVEENLITGGAESGEKFIDFLRGLWSDLMAQEQQQMSEFAYHDNLKKGMDEKEAEKIRNIGKETEKKIISDAEAFVKKDLYDGSAIAKKIIDPKEKFLGVDTEGADSVFGAKSDALVQSGGQLLASQGANILLPGTGLAVAGGMAYGAELESALNEGASWDEATLSASITMGAEMLTEKLFGGISYGGKTLDEALTKKLSTLISSKVVRNLANIGVDVVGEGTEEILADAMSSVGKKLTYKKEEELFGKDGIFSSEAALDAFIGGAVLGGIGSAGKSAVSSIKGIDDTTGLTKNELKIFDKVTKDKISEAEKGGKKLTAKEKAQIRESVTEKLERGEISTDIIEEVLGGESYKRYKAETAREEAIKKELDELRNMESGKMTDVQRERMNELKLRTPNTEMLKALKTEIDGNIRKEITADGKRLGKNRGSFLAESYNEAERGKQALTFDLSKYQGKQKEKIKAIMDRNIVNNQKHTREFWEQAARFGADKNVTIVPTTTEEIFSIIEKKKGKEYVEKYLKGKMPNAYIMDDGAIAINVKSRVGRYTLLGHELGHTMEKELSGDFRKFLFKYAESKEGTESFAERRAVLEKLYEDGLGDAEVELTNDLIGEYLFTDKDFVSRLSTENRNLFQRIWDEIKYLYKIATAGSQEARELAKLQKVFEDVYRESEKVQTEAKGEGQYSLSGVKSNVDKSLLTVAEQMENDGKSSEEIRQETGWFRSYDGKWRYEIDDSDFEFHRNGKFTNPNVLRYKELTLKILEDELSAAEAKELESLKESIKGEKLTPNTLGEIISHDALFAAYPQLKNIKFAFKTLAKNERGKYSPADNAIFINNNLIGNEAEVKKTIIHEIQHAIQDIESFARGSSVQYYQQKRQDVTDDIRDAKFYLDMYLDSIGYSEFVKESAQEVASGVKTLERHKEDVANFKRNSRYADQIAKLEADLAENRKIYKDFVGKSAAEMYLSSAGEIEARDTANRLELTEEQRKSQRPDIDREDAIVKYSLSEENAPTKQYGDFNTPANEMLLDTKSKAAVTDAPIRKDVATPTEATAEKTDIAPVFQKAEQNGKSRLITEEEGIQLAKENAERIVSAPERNTDADETPAKVLESTEKPEKGNRIWSALINLIFDKQSAIEDTSLKNKNRELMAKADFMLRSESRAQRYIKKNLLPTLEKVAKNIDRNGFETYAYHLLNIDRMTLTDRFNTPNKPVFGYQVTADASREFVKQYEATHPEARAIADELISYNTKLRQMMVDEGIITKETAAEWAEKYPHYMPIHRAGKDGEFYSVDKNKTSVNAPIKKATGGDSDIESLFDTIAGRTEQVFSAIAKNRFGVELRNTLKAQSDADPVKAEEGQSVIDAIENAIFGNSSGTVQKDENGATFTIYENGKRKRFKISEDLYDALKPANELLSSDLTVGKGKFKFAPLKTLSNIQRGLLTQYSPIFTALNAPKDAQSVLINSQHPVKTYANFPEAVWELIQAKSGTEGEYLSEYLDNGGDDLTVFDRRKKVFVEDKSVVKKVLGFVPEKISEANDFIEKIPRLAEYIASRKSGRSIEESMLDAARVTTNFAAGGELTKFLNRNGFTFLNASVQGFNQQVRNVREAKANGLKGILQLTAKYAVAGLSVMLLNHLLWDDDEEYEELSDYIKDNYYIVGKYGDGKFIRIPKGREIAVIQNAFEQMKNLVTGDDDVDMERFGELLVENIAPSNPLDNNVIAPIVQAATNKTWYGDDLVPTRLQDLPAAEQFDESTDSISKWLGEKTNISPYKINYVLDQYSGAVGDIALPWLTTESDGGGLGAGFVDKFTTDSVMKNLNIADFYDRVDTLTKNAKSSKATDEDKLKYKYMNSVNTELSDLYKQKRELQSNKYISDDAKSDAVREIQKEIVSIARNAIANSETATVQGRYATVGDREYYLNDDGEWTKLSEEQLKKQNEATGGLGISAPQYWDNKEEYDYAVDSPEKHAISTAVGGYESFKGYTKTLNGIKSDKDKNGDTISGSRKKKVQAYIQSLDIDRGQKLILHKSEYPSDTQYNREIIAYLKSRKDLSDADRKKILEALGFKVEGNKVRW